MQKKDLLGLIVVLMLPLTILFVLLAQLANQPAIAQHLPQQFFCLNKSQFIDDSQKNNIFFTKATQSTYQLNEDGTIHYLYENFDTHRDRSQVLEQFESLQHITVDKGGGDIKTDTETINGKYALKISTRKSSIKDNTLVAKSTFDSPINLNRWDNYGFLSGWLKLENKNDITGIEIKVGDPSGNFRQFNKLTNLQLEIPNFFTEDDPYPDIEYPIQESASDEWTDFSLNEGWNYLLWRMDNKYFYDHGKVDLGNISWLEIRLSLNEKYSSDTSFLLDDFRIQDGLQKNDNPLGGFWYPPHGRPQYGIYDLDQIYPGDYALKLLNVRQSQYPSNGDHGRMITKGNTPLNFTMRVKFKIVDLEEEKQQDNTWFRLMYDFDPVYDPGHDYFGVYHSMEWDKFGLLTVIPVKRFFIQEQEPEKEHISASTEDYSIKENKVYEIHLSVEGQKAKSTLYASGDNCLKEEKTVSYTFNRARYGADKRYPISLEITGNTKAIIYEVEIVEI